MHFPRILSILVSLSSIMLLPSYPTAQASNTSLSVFSPPRGTSQDSSVAYQLNPQHNGNIQGSTLTPPLRQLWTKAVGSVSYPLVVGDMVYVGTYPIYDNGVDQTPHILALNLLRGPRLRPIQAGPAIAYENGRIFTYDTNGIIEALDAKTGSQLWKMPVGPPAEAFTYPPTLYNGTVFLSGPYNTYALRETDGTILWQVPWHSFNDLGPFGAAVDNHGLYFTLGSMWGLNPLTGQITWKYVTGNGGIAYTPAVYDRRIYARLVPSQPEIILDENTGQTLGTFSRGMIPILLR